jgi:cell wall-associated NlpC family hydrolase
MSRFGNFFLRRRVLPWLVAVGLGTGASLASAAPAPESDQVMKLLADKGLLAEGVTTTTSDHAAPTRGSGLVDQVRDRASDMVLTAMNFLGVPYRRGGSSEATGFDCSGFTRHVFERSIGLVLPRRADEQATAKGLLQISRDELRPGDLVFFNTLRRTFSHVGIYVGDGKFIHSPRSGGKVRVEDMRMSYWNARFTGARRVEATLGTDAQQAGNGR